MIPCPLPSIPASPTRTSGKPGLPAEMHEQPTEVLRVFLNSVVLGLDVLALQEPQHVFLELSRPFARDDLDQRRLLFRRLVENRLQRAVVTVGQVKLQLHGSPPWTTARIAVTVCCGLGPLDTTVTRGSSGCGSSSTANWLLSRSAGKK